MSPSQAVTPEELSHETNKFPLEVCDVPKLPTAGGFGFVNPAKFKFPIDVKEIMVGSQLMVYPNPVLEETIFVKYSSVSKGNADLMIVNSLGQQVVRKSIKNLAGENTIDMNISELNEGMYFIRIIDGKNEIISKFFKGGN